MGLLTDPGVEKSKIPAFFYASHRFLAILFYFTGILWLLALAHNAVNHGTYFSENALLPGLVQGEFHGDSSAHRYLKSLEEETERHPDEMPYSWLIGNFMQIGLDTHLHNFTLHYPMANKVYKGSNIYGILRAARGSSTESLVVSAPYRPLSSLHPPTTASIALMLAIAEFFSEQVYWAKDIIFLVTEHEQLGMQAWLEAYHRSPCGTGILKSGDLSTRAGPIQAAVNLEIGTSFVSHIDVKIEGLNGQLPNLDLVNLVHRLCHRESVRHTFKNMDDHPDPESLSGWFQQLKTLASMMMTQATGIPNGNHGLFHRFAIAAVTLEGVRDNLDTRRPSNLTQLGRVLEGICRSLNNLLEKFHQSFFFYLLPATNRYISIGVYMPPFGLLGASLLSIALALWFSTSCKANERDKGSVIENLDEALKIDFSLVGKIPLLVIIHLMGMAAAWAPEHLASMGSLFGLQAEDAVSLGLLGFSASLILLPFFIGRISDFSNSSWEVLKCLVVLELSVVAFGTAVYNFSLATIVTVLYVPSVILVAPAFNRLKRALLSISLLLIHPLAVLYAFVAIDTYESMYSSLDDEFTLGDVNTFFRKSAIATKRALMYSIVDSQVYGNWVYNVGCQCLIPIWLALWFIVWHPLSVPQRNVKLKTS